MNCYTLFVIFFSSALALGNAENCSDIKLTNLFNIKKSFECNYSIHKDSINLPTVLKFLRKYHKNEKAIDCEFGFLYELIRLFIWRRLLEKLSFQCGNTIPLVLHQSTVKCTRILSVRGNRWLLPLLGIDRAKSRIGKCLNYLTRSHKKRVVKMWNSFEIRKSFSVYR